MLLESLGKYIIVRNIKGKNTFRHILQYTCCRNTYPRGRALMKMHRVVPQAKIGTYALKTIRILSPNTIRT